MIVLDENIPEGQRQLLARHRIRCSQIGVDLGQKGMQDDAIPALLMRLHRPTFFTRDQGFYRRELRHSRYCIVCLDTGREEVATFVQRLLKHPTFDTHGERLGAVLRLSSSGIRAWMPGAEREVSLVWE
ncbi:MAG TPA: hypothetical protein VF017_01320 [Thermoanaerobaculia bacterium]|nr:hypothetical protein [Thermoanaerobaculia bacterium]